MGIDEATEYILKECEGLNFSLISKENVLKELEPKEKAAV
jgi:hypothetical protein